MQAKRKDMIQEILYVLEEIWHLMNEMSPYLLLGFLLAGVLHEFVPSTLYQRYLSGNNFRSVLLSALFGIPLPLCSCGVIPTAMGLRRQGASKGATVSFLISTPQTGVDSIVATYSLMGVPFAIARPLVALVTAMFGGMLVAVVEKQKTQEETVALEPAGECHDGKAHVNMWRRVLNALRYAFVEMVEDIGKWLLIGLVVAGMITALVPDEWFAVFKDNSLYSILFVLLFAIPMYLCATGSIPIAVALMLKGLSPGAALVLLMAGPASNMASILVISKVMGTRTLLLYLLSIVGGAVCFGLAIDLLLPSEWFLSTLMQKASCCDAGPAWFSICCTVLMALLLVNALTPLKLLKGGHGHCTCNKVDSCNSPSTQDEVVAFKVKGMNCNHCATNVKEAISAVPGVNKTEVSLEKGMAYVQGDFDEEEILNNVRALGFDVDKM